MLVPVLERDGLLSDVRLLHIITLSTSGLVVAGAIRLGLGGDLGRWCGGGHVGRGCVVWTVKGVNVQGKQASLGVVWEYPEH